MNRFIEITRITVSNLWLTLCVCFISISNLSFKVMSKSQKPDYVSSEIKKVSEVDLKKALMEVKESNRKIRESFRVDRETLAFRTGR